MDKAKVYLFVKPKAALETNYSITVKDIAEVYCNDKDIKSEVENYIVSKTKKVENWMSISSIYIIEQILDKDPNLDIEITGENEVLIEIKDKVKINKLLQALKVTSIFILLFFGAGITITNFHTDVEMDTSMEIIYETLTGKHDSNPLVLNVSYSIGLGLGVIIFFNRILTKNLRRKKEPGPMEIELFNYDKEMEDYILNDINKSDKE
ncbi:MAG: hypothetical protein GX053_09600 [Tissierella sp.]|nr:hypothetical protein [Tissierella sp.]